MQTFVRAAPAATGVIHAIVDPVQEMQGNSFNDVAFYSPAEKKLVRGAKGWSNIAIKENENRPRFAAA